LDAPAPARPILLLLIAVIVCGLPLMSLHGQDDWRQDVPCVASGDTPVLRELPKPTPAIKRGCPEAACVDVREGEQVCECWHESGGGVKLALERHGSIVSEWSASPHWFATPDAFTVLTGDLDGDGKAEIVVANLEGASNGMVVATYTVAILDGANLSGPPVRFQVQEFGAKENLLYSPSRRACEILVTNWESGRDPKRGWGRYMVGQWYRYGRGRLVPDTSRPVLSRRYLNSFQSERFASMNRPFKWLRDASTEESWSSPPPFLALSPEDTEAGELAHVTEDRIEFRAARGGTRQLDASPWPVFKFDPVFRDFESIYWLLADEASGRLYPHRYVPSDPDRDFAGKRATAKTYQVPLGGRLRIISVGE
jgi:hypothetical protein